MLLVSSTLFCLIVYMCKIICVTFTAGVWSCPATTGERPSPCSDFTFTPIDGRKAVWFGGQNIDRGRMNDVYIIDFHTMVHVHVQ